MDADERDYLIGQIRKIKHYARHAEIHATAAAGATGALIDVAKQAHENAHAAKCNLTSIVGLVDVLDIWLRTDVSCPTSS